MLRCGCVSGLLPAQMQEVLKQLQAERWIDDPTRMVSVEFTLFNPYVLQYIAVRSSRAPRQRGDEADPPWGQDTSKDPLFV